jgi:dihydrofolate reductase
MSNVILYIATSQDGFIADKNGGVDWLPQPNEALDTTDEWGYQALLNKISIIVMGSQTYRQILGFGEWAWPDKTTYVFTKKTQQPVDADIHFIHESVVSFLNKPNIKNQTIWLMGGAALTTSFAKEHAIDECIITILPTILGEGIKLELPYNEFVLVETKKCSLNSIQKTFKRP